MIDFIKCDIITAPEYLLTNQNLKFGSNIDTTTGEEIPSRHGYFYKVANFEEMQICISTNVETKYTKIELTGSIHKYLHQGKNYTDFAFFEVCESIQSLCALLKLQPENFILRNVEFGVNINTIHSPESLLNSIIAYKGGNYERNEYKGNGYMKRFHFSQYDLKVYDKSVQYQLNHSVLRFELKVKKMQFFESKNILLKTFADLLNRETYQQLNKVISDSLNSVYLFDYRIDIDSIKEKNHRFILTQCINTEFWPKFRDTHSEKGYKKKVQKFKELVKLYAPNDLHNYLQIEILNKWFDLLNSTPNLPHVQNSIVSQIYPLIVGKNRELNKKYCVTCGRDISNQKNGSLYCSEKLYGKEVKRCRNKVSNRKQFEKRCYTGYILNLI